MRKLYDEPILEIRHYRLTDSILTESDPGLHDGDDYDLDSVGDPVVDQGTDSVFADAAE